MTIGEALADGAARIGGETARLDAECLLAHSLNQPRSHLITWPDQTIDAQQRGDYEHLLARRVAGEPVAYLLGNQPFWSLDLTVSPDVLIPRPETELLVEIALSLLPANANIADLGTGSGAIALALASERPDCRITATDHCNAALAVARNNARANDAEVECLQSSWFDNLSNRRFHMIVTNPPYVAEHDPHLSALRFEPQAALVSGADGLDAIREIITNATTHLHDQGHLLIEHGHDQGDAVRSLIAERGFSNVTTRQDLAGIDRVSFGQWQP